MLPDPRNTLENIHVDKDMGLSDLSSMVPLWAQFITYDIMDTGKFPGRLYWMQWGISLYPVLEQ